MFQHVKGQRITHRLSKMWAANLNLLYSLFVE